MAWLCLAWRPSTVPAGWYSGRTIHIHFRVRTFDGTTTTYNFTSQLFFDDTVSDQVLAQAPYNARGSRNTTNANDKSGLVVHGSQSRVRSNTANFNTLLGIDANPGTIDLGGDHARGNGSTHQCENVVCT